MIKESEGVESYLDSFRVQLGDDLKGYRGHIYRVLSYALHFLSPDQASRHRSIVEVNAFESTDGPLVMHQGIALSLNAEVLMYGS